MKLKFALVAFFLVVCGICLAQTKQTEEEDISRFVERYDNAWNHKDTASIERILALDYVYFWLVLTTATLVWFVTSVLVWQLRRLKPFREALSLHGNRRKFPKPRG